MPCMKSVSLRMYLCIYIFICVLHVGTANNPLLCVGCVIKFEVPDCMVHVCVRRGRENLWTCGAVLKGGGNVGPGFL